MPDIEHEETTREWITELLGATPAAETLIGHVERLELSVEGRGELLTAEQLRAIEAEVEAERLRKVLHGIAFSDHEAYPATASQLRTRAFAAINAS